VGGRIPKKPGAKHGDACKRDWEIKNYAEIKNPRKMDHAHLMGRERKGDRKKKRLIARCKATANYSEIIGG